jgi:DnaJ-class molecular chaperone
MVTKGNISPFTNDNEKNIISSICTDLAAVSICPTSIAQDTCKTIPKQEQTKPIEPLDSTKLIKCPQCNGIGTIMREIPVGFKMPKRKMKCSFCGVEYWDYIKHFHQECTLCRGKRYLKKADI